MRDDLCACLRPVTPGRLTGGGIESCPVCGQRRLPNYRMRARVLRWADALERAADSVARYRDSRRAD